MVSCEMNTRCRRCHCMIHRPRLHEEESQTGGRNALSRSLRSSDGSILFRVSGYEHGSSRPDQPARSRPFCRRRAEAISTHHGVLDTSTIDASSCRAYAARFLSHVTEGFADEQSPAALTGHKSSFCCFCRAYEISGNRSVFDPPR